jgi:hypothetical protein
MHKIPLPKHHFEKKLRAQEYLAESLKNGELTLALGAGISSGMGLPNWASLVNSCCNKVGIQTRFHRNTPTEKLIRAMNDVEDEISKLTTCGSNDDFDIQYTKLIHSCLYKEGKLKYDDSIIKKPLLVSIGALTSGSARGNVKEIITLNFDDVLEWYLSVYGLKTQVAYNLPVLRGNSDVLIYHLHGYVPLRLKSNQKSRIIFSKRSYDEYQAKENLNLQQLVWKDFLSSKVVLFIGLSGYDITFGPIFKDVKNRLKLNSPFKGPNSIWLMSPNTKEQIINEIRDWGGAPVIMDHDEYPSFILGICQKALKRT